jgi:predicted nucleic acid-binding protein
MIFLDTSFIVSYYNSQDVNHESAVKVMAELVDGTYGDILTNNFVFGECTAVFMKKLSNFEEVSKIVRDIAGFVEVDNSGKEEFGEILELFLKQKSKKFSFFDLSILVSMKKGRAKYLATFDKEFKRIKDIRVIP